MKKDIKISLLIALLFAVMTGCSANEGIVNEQEDSTSEISPDTDLQVIEKEIDGIAFKFCLLNEQGEPATVFREGENFRFYFSTTNKTIEKLVFYPEFAQGEDNGFCEVFTSDRQSVGKPFEFRGADLIHTNAYYFNPGESYVFDSPWMDSRDSLWQWKRGEYSSNHQIPLSKGDYFTEFQSPFKFSYQITGTDFLYTVLTFKINFKIQ
jgi:hypothetical protein